MNSNERDRASEIGPTSRSIGLRFKDQLGRPIEALALLPMIAKAGRRAPAGELLYTSHAGALVLPVLTEGEPGSLSLIPQCFGFNHDDIWLSEASGEGQLVDGEAMLRLVLERSSADAGTEVDLV